jgi:hypothetical protein
MATKKMLVRWKGLIAFVAFAFAMACLLGACGQGPAMEQSAGATDASRRQQLRWEKVAQFENGDTGPSPDEQARLTVVTSSQQVSELQDYVYSFVLQQVSETDFSTYLILAVFQGYRGVSNYSIDVEDVVRQGRTITVYTEFLDPDPAEVIVNITSSPYYVLKVKKPLDLYGEVTFVLIANDTEIDRETSEISPDYTPPNPESPIPTPTPYPGEIRPPSVFVTPTPLLISKTTDLAPELPDEEKGVYIIRRSDGAYERFLISVYYAGDAKELMEFGPGDVLLYHYLLKPREATPFKITAVPASGTVTETLPSP